MQRRLPLLASAAVICLGFSATAWAGSGHFNGLSAGVDIGWAHVFGQIDDVNPNYANNSGFQDVDSANGVLLGGHLGYDWQFSDHWLFGLEAGAQRIFAESAGCGAAGCSDGANGNPNLAYDIEGTGTARARFGFILNPDTMIYVAGGWAFAEVTTHHHDDDEGDGESRNFSGYTLGAGVQRAISSSTDIRLDVAYDHFSDKHWVDDFDEEFGAEPELLTVSLGAVWHLYNTEAPPPPPPPPAPPAPPPPMDNFIIFFGFNKCNITAEADRVLGEAAHAAKDRGSATIEIVGHTDTSGSARYNQRLSECRSNAAATNLEGKGIPADAIHASGKGETELMVQTGDGVKEPQNRRATIGLH